VTARIEHGIKVSLNGPYVVTRGVPIGRLVIGVDEAGNSREWRETHAYDPRHHRVVEEPFRRPTAA
jgi:hypothetical protein